jgi:hypothetical protein
MNLIFDAATDWLEIPNAVQTEAWRQSQANPVPGNCMQMYLNQVCLQTLLPWLQEKSGMTPVLQPRAPQASFWDLVNGSSVKLGQTRLVMVPSEAMDNRELRVPQEWIDIPEWAADYYLAVEVDTDEAWVRVWGYTDHPTLKSNGVFDSGDRTYALEGDELIRDLSLFWVSYHLMATPVREAIAPLPILSTLQTEHLLHRLSRADIVLPRLEVAFSQWAALLQQHQSLQTLCERRQQAWLQPAPSSSASTTIRLRQWLVNVFDAGWQSLEDVIGSETHAAFSFRRDEIPTRSVRRVKQIFLDGVSHPLLLIVMLTPEPDDRIAVRVRVGLSACNDYLPGNLELNLYSTMGDMLQAVQARSQDNSIQLKRFRCPSGTRFQIRLALNGSSFTEEFVT